MIQNRHSVLFLGDIVILFGSFFLMSFLRFDFTVQHALISAQAKLFTGIFVIWLVVFFIFDLYSIKRINPNAQNIGFLGAAMAVNTTIAVLLFYLFPQNGISPKTNLLILVTIAVALLIVWRRGFYSLFSTAFKRTIGTLGTSHHMEMLRKELAQHPHLGHVAIISKETLENLEERIDLLVAEHLSPDELLTMSTKLQTETISLYRAYELLFTKIPVELMTDEKAIDIIASQRNLLAQFFYRVIESAVAGLILIVSSPFLLLAAIAIYSEDRGPFLYTQTRSGKKGTIFTIYKIRTMRVDAEKSGAQWAALGDARITKVGAVLRKLHLDEIPQMWNIIRGDIALIGPRPERPEIVAGLEKQIPYYFLRHTVRPGFTGWAQIKFRYARTILDSKEKFEYDLYYLQNKNILLDIGIFLKTVQIIFTH